MKYLMASLISLYQVVFSSLLRQLVGVSDACRFSPTCSEYTKQMILRHGTLKGSVLGMRQLLSCHPFHYV